MAVEIVNTRPEHIEQLAAHQRRCFPTLADHELMREEHFAEHLRLFSEGQHVALDGDVVVGQSSTFRISSEAVFGNHTFSEIMGHGFFSTHEPNGEWLYGADMSVHPDYRGQKLSKRLYDARKDLVRQLGLRGIVAGGMIPDYHRHKAQMTVAEYVDAVAAGRMTDATLTPQLRSGFEVRGILYDYIEAGELGNDAVLIVWENPELQQ